jgi:hypothetical protein
MEIKTQELRITAALMNSLIRNTHAFLFTLKLPLSCGIKKNNPSDLIQMINMP